jgi:hypothetical protein
VITIPLHLLLLNTKKTEKIVDRNDFSGPRNLENIAYQDYLVRAYKIEKNEILSTYKFDNKVFENLEKALYEASIIDRK